jgi:hypothetical protein
VDFWFAPRDPVGLHALRLLAGLLFLGWLLPFAGHEQAFFGLQGWFDTRAYEDTVPLPVEEGARAPIGWSLLYLAGTSPAAITAFYWGSLLVLAAFTLGLWTRVTAVLTWLIVVSFTANPAIAYDADFLLVILAFYLMIGYVLLGQWSWDLSPAERLLGPQGTFLFGLLEPAPPPRAETEPAPPSNAANLAVRLIQVHFAIVVVVSGLHKLQFGDWWSGTAFFFPLLPPMETTPESLRALADSAGVYFFWLSLAQYLVLGWQLAFPAFAWRRGWRWLLVGGAVIGWLGSALLYKLPLFGPVYLIGCLSYLTPEEWRRITGWVTRLRRRDVPVRPATAAPSRAVKVARKG